MTEQRFSYLYAYVAGETASKAQYKITFNQIENYQPQINSSPIEIAEEDTEWTYTLQVSDANNDNLSYVIESLNGLIGMKLQKPYRHSKTREHRL